MVLSLGPLGPPGPPEACQNPASGLPEPCQWPGDQKLDLVTKSWPSAPDFPIFSRQKVRPPEFSTCPLQKNVEKKSLPSLRDVSRTIRLEIPVPGVPEMLQMVPSRAVSWPKWPWRPGPASPGRNVDRSPAQAAPGRPGACPGRLGTQPGAVKNERFLL